MSAQVKFQRFIVLVLIAVGFFYGGMYFGKRGYEIEIKKNPPKISVINKNPKDQEIDFEQFWRVWELMRTQYLERPVDAGKMLQGAISGMVGALGDPYTAYYPPQINQAINAELNNEYQGIGAELGIQEGQLIVVTPLDGSPAKKAGVLAGDKILEIDGETTYGIAIPEAVAKIRGDAGTVSALTLSREKQEPFEVKITRGVITIDSVMWEDKGDGTVYIRVSRFGSETNEQWDKVVKEIGVKMDQLDAIILDLRSNPGGYLRSSVHLAGEFYRNKPVLYQESATGEDTLFDTTRVGSFERIPALYVLIDGGSASASEILAAALDENADAVLIGEKSFGKGTIQDTQEFNDGSGVHITTAKWLTPSKEWVHKVGIEPDIVVERSVAHIQGGVDNQLDKALELAKEN